MSEHTSIEWCDSSENLVMGCDGCPLFPGVETVRANLVAYLSNWMGALRAKALLSSALMPETLTGIYQSRDEIAQRISRMLRWKSCERIAFERRIAAHVSCYAATLHLRRGLNVNKPEKKGHKGYAPVFERVTLFPGRMRRAARWRPLDGTDRSTKPWLNKLPRLIFVSDMGDALSAAVDFEYLIQEIIHVVSSPDGRRHTWLWLTKRPARMARFGAWLNSQKVSWPDNLVAMTSVLDAKMAKAALKFLRMIPAHLRGVSVEPLLEPVQLDLEGIDWVIVGGESGPYARPFDLAWARKLRDQCRSLKVAFFMKQLGSNPVDVALPLSLNDSHGGNWMEWPEDLRIRQVPLTFKRECGVYAPVEAINQAAA